MIYICKTVDFSLSRKTHFKFWGIGVLCLQMRFSIERIGEINVVPAASTRTHIFISLQLSKKVLTRHIDDFLSIIVWLCCVCETILKQKYSVNNFLLWKLRTNQDQERRGAKNTASASFLDFPGSWRDFYREEYQPWYQNFVQYFFHLTPWHFTHLFLFQ